MPNASRVLYVLAWTIVLVLAALVAYGIAGGEINVRGLLRRKGGGRDVAISPERLQLLLTTVAAAATYLARAAAARMTGRMPDVSGLELFGVGASHATYLVAKAATFLTPRAHTSAQGARE
jgi:hypothetical protein